MTGKSTKSWIVVVATMILYVCNVIGSALVWRKIPLLIGISGESRLESILAELNSYIGISGLSLQILPLVSFVVADGLLVRSSAWEVTSSYTL